MSKFLLALPIAAAVSWIAPVVGAEVINRAPVPLPVGAMLMLDKYPDPVPEGWEKCGYLRTEQVEELGKPHVITDYACIRKKDAGVLP